MTATHFTQTLASSELGTPQKRWVRIIVFLAIMLVGTGQTIVYALLAPVGRQIGLTAPQIGMVITFASLAYAITTPLWGVYSHRHGQKGVLIIGLAGFGFGTLAFTLVLQAGLLAWLAAFPVFIALVITRMCLCALMSAVTPAATAFMTELTAIDHRTSGMSLIATSQAIGSVLGPAFAMLSGVHLLLPLYLLIGLTLIVTLMTGVKLPASGLMAAELETTSWRERWPERSLWPYCVIGTGVFTVFSMVQVSLGYHFQDAFRLSTAVTAQKVGMTMMATAAGVLVAQAIFVRAFTGATHFLLVAGLFFLGAGLGGAGITQGFGAAVFSMAVAGLGLGMTIPAYMALASIAGGEKHRGMVAGIISACPAVGFIIGPLSGSLLYSVENAYPFIASVLLCAVLFAYALFRSLGCGRRH